MSELVPSDDVPEDAEALLGYLVDLVERGRHEVAIQVNARSDHDLLARRPSDRGVLRNGRAEYGREIVATLGHELTARFGPGFDPSNLSRMMAFSRQFPDHAEVAAPSDA